MDISRITRLPKHPITNPDGTLGWDEAGAVVCIEHEDAIEVLSDLRDKHELSMEKLYDQMQHQKDAMNRRLGKTPPEDPKGIAGQLKPQLQLVPPVIIESMAAALKIGADKYGPWNWRGNKVEIMTYLGAMKRHIDVVLEREDIDPESGTHHLGHVAAGCAIVLDALAQGTLVDNRPPARPGYSK